MGYEVVSTHLKNRNAEESNQCVGFQNWRGKRKHQTKLSAEGPTSSEFF